MEDFKIHSFRSRKVRVHRKKNWVTSLLGYCVTLVAQAGMELMAILLPQSLHCSNYSCDLHPGWATLRQLIDSHPVSFIYSDNGLGAALTGKQGDSGTDLRAVSGSSPHPIIPRRWATGLASSVPSTSLICFWLQYVTLKNRPPKWQIILLRTALLSECWQDFICELPVCMSQLLSFRVSHVFHCCLRLSTYPELSNAGKTGLKGI